MNRRKQIKTERNLLMRLMKVFPRKQKGNENYNLADLRAHASASERVHVERVQANKSTRGMPWHWEPKKDVTSCDKPRGGANSRNIRGFPNGETSHTRVCDGNVNP